MKSILDSRKFIAAILSSVIMGVLVAVGIDLTTATLIVAPLAAYVPFQAIADLKSKSLTDEEVEALKKLLPKE